MKKIGELKNKMVGTTLTDGELENVMFEAGYVPFETDEMPNGVIGIFTDSKKLIYVKGTLSDGDIEVTDVTANNNINNKNEATKVDPFHSYEDLEAVMNYFLAKNQYNHWLACRLMVGLGRRSGDTLNLRWCDLYKNRECTKFFDRCMKLKEEKTGKIIAPHITEYVQMSIEEYCKHTGVNPSDNYIGNIFSVGTPAVRAAVKRAVDAVGIDYPVSLHSFRKTYGNWTYKIHKNEGVCLEIIRGMFGHSDTGITRLYIDQTNEDARRYADDLSNFLINKENGTTVEINNAPNVTVKANTLREILSAMFDAGADGHDKFTAINNAISRIEREGF